MSTVTQLVPNYVLGISEQPDELKLAGQVKDLVNAIPDVTLGCVKRPGSKYVTKITPNSGTLSWFHIYNDSDNQYIGNVDANGRFQIWRTSDVASIPLDYSAVTPSTNVYGGTGYYGQTTAGFSAVLKPGGANKVTATIPNHGLSTGQNVKIRLTWNFGGTTNTINNSYANSYAIIKVDDNTIDINGLYTGTLSNINAAVSYQNPNSAAYLDSWTDSTDIQALTINENTFFTNRTVTTAMKSDAADKSPALVNEVIVEIKTISYGKQYALNIYDPANPGTPITETRATTIAHDEHSVHGAWWKTGTSIANDGSCDAMGREVISVNGYTTQAGSGAGKNLRLEFDVRCVPVVDPSNIGTGTSGPEYNDAYSPFVKLQFGGEGWQTGDTFVVTKEDGFNSQVKVTGHTTMKSSANIAAVRPPATSSSADEAVTASGILGDMKSSLDAISGTGITATITGNCLHLKRNTPFAVSTPEPQLMNIVTNQANNIGELPTNCRHDFVVKIVNSGDDDDDFYLKFNQNNAGTANQDYFGEGVWEECPAPDLEIEIDKDTMPVRLIRELPGNTYPNGRFVCQSIDYTKRGVGDDNTNPVPSFIGSPLQKMLFFRNRLVVLSQNNVITSKTNDFFNFFSTSAMTETSSDPIDLQASSTFPTTIFDGIEVNAGLLLFSSNQQFMLTTDSDALTPTTAKVNYLSSYNYNPKTVPFSMGVTSGFINSTGKNSRIFEMADIRREGEPTVLEQSKLVSKKLPINLTIPTTSRENSLLMLGAQDYNEIWVFRYYSNGEKRVQSAWTRWSLSGSLIHHVILDDVYYLVVQSGSDVILESIDVKKQDDTKIIGTESYPIHLDRHTQMSALSSSSYSATTKKTTFARPTGFASTAQLAVYNHNSGNDIGRYALANANGSNLEIEGDWTGTAFMLGYLFEFLVEIPSIYVTQSAGEKSRSDTRSSLVIHRLHIAFGEVGNIDTTIKRKGRVDYTTNFSAAEIDSIDANELPIVEDYIQTIPIYERNTNLNIQIKSTHPSPATLHSMNWEGDYNPRYYRRV